MPCLVRQQLVHESSFWKLTSTVSWCRLSSSMIYFAISLYPMYLSGNRLLNIFFSGLAEVPAVIVAYFLPQFCGRVKSTSLLYIICGVSCAISPFLKKGTVHLEAISWLSNQKTFIISVNAAAVTILILISKTTVTAAFDLIYVITSEVSPTLVRSTSLGVASMCARIGGIAMPFLMLAGKG